MEKVLVIADSAEPKSIDELTVYGVDIVPAIKGQGSVLMGIQSVQNRKISVTKRSTNLLKEYRSYLWDTDVNGRNINKPTQGNDHAMDAIRYAVSDMFPFEPIEEVVKKETRLLHTYHGTIKDDDQSGFYDEQDYSQF